eukprot:maker-scaffold893_size84343-snap-gene-0.22 protein:Tk04547 transcript:maker-scaffold893_size84343-snap-gene-0.22-mRNA-1 annotation:"proton-coupled amino acid transporter 4"
MGPRRLSNVSYTPISAVSAGGAPPEKFVIEDVAKHGLGVGVASVVLAGEMAGSGVLALPAAMIGTGWMGLSLIIVFTINACYSGTRLGQCWVILEERYPEFKGIIRDPYPTIGERAVGYWGRVVSIICITITLYGGGCVFIVLIAQLLGSLLSTWAGVHFSLCTTLEGSFKAFGSIMFAFAGASTFPTIQADMKHREQFNTAATIACGVLFLIYFPMAAGGYFSFGDLAQPNIVLSISDGPVRLIVEVMLLLHLVAAFPIITNPPSQFFEYMLGIPAEFNWKRCLFRSLSVCFLLFIAETVPSFGSILDLVGASTVTLLTFVFPPYFYMRLVDASSKYKDCTQHTLPLWERIYCWLLIIIGCIGGACATYTAMKNIFSAEFQIPCYLQTGNESSPVALCIQAAAQANSSLNPLQELKNSCLVLLE